MTPDTLGTDASHVALAIDPARRPRKRDLYLQKDSTQINLLEFLRLNSCALGEVIGQGNSVLGRVAPDSQRLFTDLDFLRLAPACVERLRDAGDMALADTLVEAVDLKRSNLEVAIANATLGSEEFSSLWRVPSSIDRDILAEDDLPIEELQYVESAVKRWLSGDYTHDAKRFERALGRLRKGKAGHLIAAAVLTQSHLNAADELLRMHLGAPAACSDASSGIERKTMHSTLDALYVAEIRPWIAATEDLHQSLMIPYRSLERSLASAQSPAYRQWQEDRDKQLAWLATAPQHHEQTLRAFAESCGDHWQR